MTAALTRASHEFRFAVTDGSLGPHRWALSVNGDTRPEWVAFEVAGCTPDGWETT